MIGWEGGPRPPPAPPPCRHPRGGQPEKKRRFKKKTHARFDWLPGELTPAANHSTRMVAQKEYDWITPGWAPRGSKHGEVHR